MIITNFLDFVFQRLHIFLSFVIYLHKAQKRGLVDAPTARLTDREWQDVKNKSNRRNDSDQPCVICKEEFGTQHQVSLGVKCNSDNWIMKHAIRPPLFELNFIQVKSDV